MSDALQTFLDETSTERFSIEAGGCGVWAIRWNIRKTGMCVPLPAVRSWADAAALDMMTVFRAYAGTFGLVLREEPQRGDTGIFDRTALFERRGDHVVGIYAGDGFWAFKTMSGVKFLADMQPIEVWG